MTYQEKIEFTLLDAAKPATPARLNLVTDTRPPASTASSHDFLVLCPMPELVTPDDTLASR
jgi:hypothetical protein